MIAEVLLAALGGRPVAIPERLGVGEPGEIADPARRTALDCD